MARASVISPYQKFWDISGLNALSNGTVEFFQNMTTDPADIFADSDLTVPQENPYPLDGGGRISGDVHFNGTLSLDLYDENGAFQYRIDGVTCFDPFTAFSDWDEFTTYSEGGPNIVTGSNGNYYISTADNNQGHDPTDPLNVPAWWEEVQFFRGSTEDYDRMLEIAQLTPANQNLIIGTGTAWSTVSVASILRNFLSGLETANNATDADHDIDVAPGRCNDSTNAFSLILGSAFTKRIDATWAAGSGNGGLASGASLTTNTTYHVFVVLVGNAVDVMFDSSVVCANGVANNAVTSFRRIASIMTDGSSNIRPYFQRGDNFTWDVMVQDVSAANPGTSAVTSALTVPGGVEMLANCMVSLESADTTNEGYLLITALKQEDTTPSIADSNVVSSPQVDFPNIFGALVLVETNTLRQIRRRLVVSSAGATTDYTVYINTLGWSDLRGK